MSETWPSLGQGLAVVRLVRRQWKESRTLQSQSFLPEKKKKTITRREPLSSIVLKRKKKKENVIRKWNQKAKHDKWSLGFTQVHRCGSNHAMCSPKSFFFLPSSKDTPYFSASSSVRKAMWLGSHQWNCGQKRWMLLSDQPLKLLSLSLLPCLLNAEDSEKESKGLRDGKTSL